MSSGAVSGTQRDSEVASVLDCSANTENDNRHIQTPPVTSLNAFDAQKGCSHDESSSRTSPPSPSNDDRRSHMDKGVHCGNPSETHHESGHSIRLSHSAGNSSRFIRHIDWEVDDAMILPEPFAAINPYVKPATRRGRAASMYSASSIKREVEAEPWDTPVPYTPIKPSGSRRGTLSSIQYGEAVVSTESIDPHQYIHPHTPHGSRPSSRRGRYSPSPERFRHDSVAQDEDDEDSEARPVRFDKHPTIIPSFPLVEQGTFYREWQQSYPSIPKQHSPGSSSTIDDLPLHSASFTAAGVPGRNATVLDWFKYVSRIAYLYMLLGLPSLYFTRVAAIFNDANIDVLLMKRLALDSASTRRLNLYDAPSSPPGYTKLKRSWHYFIDSLIKEWKTLNIVSVLLLSAILSLLQIDSVNADPWVHYAAICSLICALVSLLLGCMYIIRFNTMRKTYKAIAWAQETKREFEEVGVLWNVWILLALPAVWLSWSLIFYVTCIVAYLWRGDPESQPKPFSAETTLAIRCVLSCTIAIAAVYGGIVVKTFIDFGAPMDRRFNEQVEEWMWEKARQNGSSLRLNRSPKRSYETFNHSTWSGGWNKSEPVIDVIPVTGTQYSDSGATRPTKRESSRTERHANQKVRFDVPSSPSTTSLGPASFGRSLSESPLPLAAGNAEEPSSPSDSALSSPTSEALENSGSRNHLVSTTAPNIPTHASYGRDYAFSQSSSIQHSSVVEPLTIAASDPRYSGLFTRSIHQIRYGDRVYPTAVHLFEAMKFVKQHPGLAEQIRCCPNVETVCELSRQALHCCRPDWNEVWKWKLEKVLYLKFTQHEELRDILLDTHPHPIHCTDLESDELLSNRLGGLLPEDAYGSLLGRVRERIREHVGRHNH